MENLLQPTFLNGRYRLDRLVVAHDDVTIWKATDVARGRHVQLNIFERGGVVVHQGKTEDGMFVVIDSSSASSSSSYAPPRALELVDPSAPAEPSARGRRRRRVWPWVTAGLACALLAAAGWYVTSDRSPPVASETTITAAQIPVAAAPTIPAPPAVTPVTSVAKPDHHERAAPRPSKPQLPKPVRPRAQPSPASSYDPLTI